MASQFWQRLKDLGFSSYSDYLESRIWKSFKSRYRSAGLPCVCAVCGTTPVQLHHHTYERLGAEELDDVTPLCGDHHLQVHACLKTLSQSVAATQEAIRRIRAGEAFDPALVLAPGPAKGSSKKQRKKARRLARQARAREQWLAAHDKRAARKQAKAVRKAEEAAVAKLAKEEQARKAQEAIRLLEEQQAIAEAERLTKVNARRARNEVRWAAREVTRSPRLASGDLRRPERRALHKQT